MDTSQQPNPDNDLDLSDLDPSTRFLIQSMNASIKANQQMMQSQLQSHQLLVATLISQARGNKKESTIVSGVFNTEIKPNMPGGELNPIQLDDDDDIIKQEPLDEELSIQNQSVGVSANSDVEQNTPGPSNTNQQKCIRCHKGQIVKRQRCKTCLKKLQENNTKVREKSRDLIDIVKRRHEKTDKRVSFASSSSTVATSTNAESQPVTAQVMPILTAANESAVQTNAATQNKQPAKRGRPLGSSGKKSTAVEVQSNKQPGKRGRRPSNNKGICTECEVSPAIARGFCSRCYNDWYSKSKREGTFVAMKKYPPNRRGSAKRAQNQEEDMEIQVQRENSQFRHQNNSSQMDRSTSNDSNDPSYSDDEDEEELVVLDDTPPEIPNEQVQHLQTQSGRQVVVDLETQKIELVETTKRKSAQIVCNGCKSVLKGLSKSRPLKSRFCKPCYQSLTKEQINNLRICKSCHLCRVLKGSGKCAECFDAQLDNAQGSSNNGDSTKWELLK